MSLHRIRRPAALLLPALAAVLVLAGCGERDEDLQARPSVERLSLLLDGPVDVDHAGVLLARDGGALERTGVALDVRTPAEPGDVVRALAAGDVDVGVLGEQELLRAREGGVDLVAFATLVQRPQAAILSLPGARISGLGDLRGRTIAVDGDDEREAFLDAVLRGGGVDPDAVRRVDVGDGAAAALLGRRADAALGTTNRDVVRLRRDRRRPRTITPQQAGVPPYDELVLVARGATLDRREAGIRRLVAGLAAGHLQVRRDPAAAVAAVQRAGGGRDRALLADELRATVPAFFPADRTRPWGWIDFDEWATHAGWMRRTGLLREQQPLDSAASRDFLAGQGTGRGRNTPEGRTEGPARRPEGYRGA